jgi:cytochrome c oxidase subunit 2
MARLPLLALSVLAATIAGSSNGQEQAAPPRVVHVTAERFAFTPSEITIDQGTIVELRITSEDTNHGFRLIGPNGPTDINVEIPKRGRGDVRVVFEGKEPGTYLFECSRVCGAGHGFMRGMVKVRARQGT